MRLERISDALLVVDLQHDFLPGGALAVGHGDEVVAPIAALAPAFETVVATQDWHPPGHVSFASAHPGRRPFETLALPQGPQELWPDHCLRGTRGAARRSIRRSPTTRVFPERRAETDAAPATAGVRVMGSEALER